MKRILLLSLAVMMLSFFACEKENISEMSESPSVQLGPPPTDCDAAFFLQSSSPSRCRIFELGTGNVIADFTNGTIYPTLSINSSYLIRVVTGSTATLHYCSCGTNNGSIAITGGINYYFDTGSNPDPYTTCPF